MIHGQFSDRIFSTCCGASILDPMDDDLQGASDHAGGQALFITNLIITIDFTLVYSKLWIVKQ